MPEIPALKNLSEAVFRISNEKDFRRIALAVFHYQYANNPVYHSYCNAIGKIPASVDEIEEIPFLPISFFKTHSVKSSEFNPAIVFKSSGTTGQNTSRHYIKEPGLYEQSFLTCFERFFGEPEKYCILGLLPSYLEQGASSLVYMVDTLIKKSGHQKSGFYLYDHQGLFETISGLESQSQPALLFGVTYALLDFAEKHSLELKNTLLIETGGMKGRKRELTKTELYQQLQRAFSVSEIHSEYGMTELLSQAYAVNGLYQCPPWMRVILRDETDPFALGVKSGAVNFIDLANIYSCSFIATEDLGKMHPDGRFETLGRLDNTDIRGCSQLVL